MIGPIVARRCEAFIGRSILEGSGSGTGSTRRTAQERDGKISRWNGQGGTDDAAKGGRHVYGIPLILFLVSIGGGIAYLGDRVGMRLGRRRLTLFGLRPRHSSIVVTVVTGAFIAAFSLAVLAVASKDVQTALFHMEELRAELAQMSEALRASEEELAGVKKALAGHWPATYGTVRRESDRRMDAVEGGVEKRGRGGKEVAGDGTGDPVPPTAVLYREGEVIAERVMEGRGTGDGKAVPADAILDDVLPGEPPFEEELLGLLADARREAAARGVAAHPEDVAIRVDGEEFVEALRAARQSMTRWSQRVKCRLLPQRTCGPASQVGAQVRPSRA